MIDERKVPSGRDIWNAVREELRLNLYELPFSTICPTVYHVYLHADDYRTVEGVVPRLVAELQHALSRDVEQVNRRLGGSARRLVDRVARRQRMAPVEVPPGGWEITIAPDRDGDLARGHIGILSSLALPAPSAFQGTPTTRIVRSVVGGGRRTSTASEVQPAAVAHSGPTPCPTPSSSEDGPKASPTARIEDGPERAARARLTYDDDQGSHEFLMQKDSLVIGRGGSAAWVDVQVVTTARVSREHVRVRREPSGRFVIQDVSLWGTSVDGLSLPPALKTAEGVLQPGAERELPPSARIVLAEAVAIRFEAVR
jgi:hypothetical protein